MFLLKCTYDRETLFNLIDSTLLLRGFNERNTTKGVTPGRVLSDGSRGLHRRVRIRAGHNDSCCFQFTISG